MVFTKRLIGNSKKYTLGIPLLSILWLAIGKRITQKRLYRRHWQGKFFRRHRISESDGYFVHIENELSTTIVWTTGQ